MTLDAVANFIKLTVSGTYGTSDTSINLASGGSSLPATPFNMSWWNSTNYPDPSLDPNVEIVRVTNVSGNTLTVTRAQESTSASTKNGAGTYSIMLGITAKMITDIGNNLQKPWRSVNVSGTINSSNTTFTISPAPFDANSLQLLLDRQPQIQGIDYTFSGSTITYVVPPDASLSGAPHTCQYQ
jgi:hypothetical protein